MVRRPPDHEDHGNNCFDEETAWPSGPGTADVLYLLEKCSAALIVIDISEAVIERSLKMSGVLNSSFADVAKRTRIS
jgi:hypothetical protein